MQVQHPREQSSSIVDRWQVRLESNLRNSFTFLLRVPSRPETLGLRVEIKAKMIVFARLDFGPQRRCHRGGVAVWENVVRLRVGTFGRRRGGLGRGGHGFRQADDVRACERAVGVVPRAEKKAARVIRDRAGRGQRTGCGRSRRGFSGPARDREPQARLATAGGGCRPRAGGWDRATNSSPRIPECRRETDEGDGHHETSCGATT